MFFFVFFLNSFFVFLQPSFAPPAGQIFSFGQLGATNGVSQPVHFKRKWHAMFGRGRRQSIFFYNSSKRNIKKTFLTANIIKMQIYHILNANTCKPLLCFVKTLEMLLLLQEKFSWEGGSRLLSVWGAPAWKAWTLVILSAVYLTAAPSCWATKDIPSLTRAATKGRSQQRPCEHLSLPPPPTTPGDPATEKKKKKSNAAQRCE